MPRGNVATDPPSDCQSGMLPFPFCVVGVPLASGLHAILIQSLQPSFLLDEVHRQPSNRAGMLDGWT